MTQKDLSSKDLALLGKIKKFGSVRHPLEDLGYGYFFSANNGRIFFYLTKEEVASLKKMESLGVLKHEENIVRASGLVHKKDKREERYDDPIIGYMWLWSLSQKEASCL